MRSFPQHDHTSVFFHPVTARGFLKCEIEPPDPMACTLYRPLQSRPGVTLGNGGGSCPTATPADRPIRRRRLRNRNANASARALLSIKRAKHIHTQTDGAVPTWQERESALGVRGAQSEIPLAQYTIDNVYSIQYSKPLSSSTAALHNRRHHYT